MAALGVVMRKNEVEASSPGLERSPAKRLVRKDGESRAGTEQFGAGRHKDDAEASMRTAHAGADTTFHSHRELGAAILAAGNPVKVGCELLDKETSEDRGAANRLRSLQTFADWAFEKPGTEGYRKPPRIIWDIPGPPYEPVEPEEREGGDK
jgi:hypothetical protein